MNKQYLQFKVASATNNKITIVASDETLDRMGDVIPLDAWDLRNYKRNPVLLVDHEYKVSNIVGRAMNLRVSDNALTFEPEFHDITELARQVKKMVEDGFAPAVSVGFLSHGPKKDGDRGVNELLEVSFVAVGANPNALSLAMKSIDADQEKKIEQWVGKDVAIVKEVLLHTGAGETSIELEFADGEKQVFAADADMVDRIYKNSFSHKAELVDQVAQLTSDLVDVKEGRVLSGKNRTKIQEGVSALKQAAAVLEDLLLATDPSAEKSVDGTTKGRETAEEQGKGVPKKANPSVVRVLQSINKDTNLLLQELKK